MKSVSPNTKRVAFGGLMLALALVLSFIEQQFPVLPFLPPGVKLGLSNIICMYALFSVGLSMALSISVAKALFVFLMRGLTAGALSLGGGLLSLLGMFFLNLLFRKSNLSYMFLSISGGVLHNLGQYFLVVIISAIPFFSLYLAALIFFGALMGTLTGLIFSLVYPAMEKINPKKQGEKLP